MKKFFYIQIIFFCQFLAAATVEFRSDAGKTNFTAIGKPAMIKIQGEGEGPVGNLIFSKDLVSGTLKVSLDRLSTGIKMRDNHMKNKYLEVEKFPLAELILKDVKMPLAVDQWSSEEKSLSFSGDLKMRGKTKSVTGTLKIKKVKNEFQGTAEFSIEIMKYLETIPDFAGMKVADVVAVKIDLNGKLLP